MQNAIIGFILGVVLSVICFSSTASASPQVQMPRDELVLDPARTSIVYGGIEGRNALPLIRALAAVKDGEYTLLIDSPGGLVSAGIRIMQTMRLVQARGVKIRCIVTGGAMSMAFFILSECDSRYALPTAGLLWHPIRVFLMGPMTGPDAVKLGNTLNRYEGPLLTRLALRLPMEPKQFRKHWLKESIHFPEQVNELSPGWITVVESVVGLDVWKLQAITTEQELLDRLKQRGKNELILIYSPLFNPR